MSNRTSIRLLLGVGKLNFCWLGCVSVRITEPCAGLVSCTRMPMYCLCLPPTPVHVRPLLPLFFSRSHKWKDPGHRDTKHKFLPESQAMLGISEG